MILTDEQIQQALLNTGIDQVTVDGFVEYPHSTSIVMNGVELHTFVEIIEKMIVPEGCHVVAMDDEDIMVKQGAALIAAHKKGE